ncbi:MAG: DNA translocase FtsK 4TM domain-containing protein, partial [Sedimentisphaerales bacterium]|nr:DNA translocase FtsK 4TM domain-containing protein [Sedimentisphaerales bacterium]
MSETKYINRIALSFLGLVFCGFLIISLLGFSIYDWPNPDVAPTYQFHNQADYQAITSLSPENPCGRVGAWLAYHVNYYFGPGFIVLLISCVIMLVLFSLKKPVEQLFLRIIGIFLMCLAISAGTFLCQPGNDMSLSCGNGGIIGIATGHFLLTNTATAGAAIIVIATLLVGALLAADNLLLMLPRLLWHLVEHLRQAGPVLASVSAAGKKAMPSRGKKTENITKYEINKKSRTAVAVAEPQELEEEYLEEYEGYQEQAPEDEYQEDEEYEEDDVLEDEISEQADDVLDDDIAEEDEIEAQEIEATEQRRQASRNFTGPTVSALARMLGQKTTDASPAAAGEVVDYSNYKYPPAELLEEPVYGYNDQLAKAVKQRAKVLEQTLREFKIETEVVAIETGPVITMFELKLAPGTKVSQITRLNYDIARSLGAPTIRVVAPIPGKQT